RGAGDDRHLRFCSWLVASALWIDDCVGASGASDDGAVAPARRGRNYHGFQFPRGGLVVEQCFGCGLRRFDGVEAFQFDSADGDLGTRGILFGAVGTAGQRCTTTRRIIVHESIRDKLTARLIDSYKQVQIGSPLEAKTLMGPLINKRAVEDMQKALENVRLE